MSFRSPRPESFRSAFLPNLVLPIGTAQPSLVLLAVTASFLVAFCLTFCFVGYLPKSQQTPAAMSPSIGLLYPF
jgi:hypothetical protein